MVKIHGRQRRAERAARKLHEMRADPRSTAYVCQDESMKKALSSLGFSCVSFHDVIDDKVELTTWSEAIAVRNEMLTLLSRAPFNVRHCQCPEGLIGVDADQFAFLSAVVTLWDKLVSAGFERVVFLPAENYLSRIPDRTIGSCHIAVDRRGIETLKAFLKRLHPYVLPLLSVLMRRSVFQACFVYRLEMNPRRGSGSGERPIRTLITASDSPDFPSYYSRPAASIGEACAKEGHQTLILTNLLASPSEYIKHGFRRASYRKLVLTEMWRVWTKTLRLRRYASYWMARKPEGISEPLWHLACQVVKENLMARASALTAAITLFDDVLARFLPDVLVVMPDNSYFGVAAIAVARRRGVPSLTALAGQIFDHPQYGFLYADVAAVNNDSAKEVYVKHGIASDRVFVAGMAHYDDTFRLAEALLKSRRQTESKVILFATENLPVAETLRMISPVIDAALAIPQARVVIRPHPRENPTNYTDFVKRCGSDRVTLDIETPLLELLSKADVCVTGFSNVAVEAMILRCPVICMNLTGNPDKLPYAEEGAALGVHHPDEVNPAIAKALLDEGTKTGLKERQTAYLKKQFSTTTGGASARIARLLEELAKRPINTERTKPMPGTGPR